jgi:HD-like signal output (HDOD) protein
LGRTEKFGLALGEVAAWLALYQRFAAIETTLILLGINLVIAIVFGLLAARSSPSLPEREALRVRQQSLDAVRGALSLAALIPVGNTLLRHWRNNGRALVRR